MLNNTVQTIFKHWGSYGTYAQFSLDSQFSLTHCDPMACSMPVFPVHHQHPELTQTRVHWVGDAIPPFHPQSAPLLPPSIFPSFRVFSSESVLHIRWPKYWNFSFSISPSERLLLNHDAGILARQDSWPPEEKNSIWGPRQGLIAQSFCVIKFY